MNSDVMVALITGGASVLAIIITSIATHLDVTQKLDKQQAVFEAHVTEQINGVKADVRRLETAQNKHNEVIDRTYALERKAEMQETEIKRHAERIRILEGGK